MLKYTVVFKSFPKITFLYCILILSLVSLLFIFKMNQCLCLRLYFDLLTLRIDKETFSFRGRQWVRKNNYVDWNSSNFHYVKTQISSNMILPSIKMSTSNDLYIYIYLPKGTETYFLLICTWLLALKINNRFALYKIRNS